MHLYPAKMYKVSLVDTQKIHEEGGFALEMLLLTNYKDVIIAGRSDSVLFKKGRPLIVFEYKFSKRQIPFKTHHVQAGTYGILLRNLGFDTSRLFYAIILADPNVRNDKQLTQKVVNSVMKNGPKEAELNIKNAAIHVCKFVLEEAEKDLDWAIEFWKNTREPISISNPNKCKNCEYKTECPAGSKLEFAND